MGMKVETTCIPAPPLCQDEPAPVRQSGLCHPTTQSVHQNGAHRHVEEIYEGATDINGEHKHQIHDEQKIGIPATRLNTIWSIRSDSVRPSLPASLTHRCASAWAWL